VTDPRLEASSAKPTTPGQETGTPAASPGRSFGRVAEAYERGRPSWPAAAVDLAAGDLGLAREDAVLDLGAGTGKLTRLLLERFDRVVSLEPDASMRALLPAAAETLAGTAEEIPLPEGSVAAVFCGESFHWFDWPRAIPEIARVLRPGGGLVLMWNRPSGGLLESAEWPPGVSELLDSVGDPSPPERRYASFAWREALADTPFAALHSEVVPNPGWLDRDSVIARISSWSPIASMPDGPREALLSELGALLTENTYRASLETHLYWARLAA
jgi:SAM-dependent methyltransferase